jgi:hypothetical protein
MCSGNEWHADYTKFYENAFNDIKGNNGGRHSDGHMNNSWHLYPFSVP